MKKTADIRDPHGHIQRATFEQLQPMYMSQNFLSAEPHISSFGAGAKFNKELLQLDKLTVSKLQGQHENMLDKTNKDKISTSGPTEKRAKQHPYFLRSRCSSIP